MAVVGLAPITLKAATLSVDGDDFTAAVNEVTFEPDPRFDHAPGFDGSFRPFWSGTRWSVAVGFAQDVTAGSLTRYLLDRQGTTVTLMFTPLDGSDTVTATALALPGQVGGPTGELLTSAVSLPLTGAPVIG